MCVLKIDEWVYKNTTEFITPISMLFVFLQVVNIFKWLKLMHKVQKKEFTSTSKLPPDLKIKVQASSDIFIGISQNQSVELSISDSFYMCMLSSLCTFQNCTIQQKIKNLDRLIRLVFANGLGDQGSIPSRVIPKTLKMVLDTSLLNTQQYKVRIKGKVEHSREMSSAFSYISL